MARETKIGMVVGIGFIVCFAIVLSHRGQLTGVDDKPGFEIESILSEAPTQSDSEQVRRNARQIGQKHSAPTRQRSMDRHTSTNRNVADAGSTDRTVPSQDNHSRPTEPQRESITDRSVGDNGQVEEAPQRFAQAQPTRRMGDSPSGPQRFSARRDPIAAEAESKPVAAPIDLTTGESQFESVDQRSRDEASGDRLTSSAPTANIRLPRTESTRDRDSGVQTMTTEGLRNRFAGGTEQPTRRPNAQESRQPLVGQPQYIGEHVIESGDTLVRIARKYYQSEDPSVVTAIFEANRDQLKSPDRIVTNRRLQLPYIEGHSSSALPARPAATNLAPIRNESNVQDDRDNEPTRSKTQPPLHRDPKRYYEIQSGDTLGEIAKKQYGTAHPDVLKQIQQANPKAIPDLNTVVKGRRIELPPIDGLDDQAGQVAPAKARLASAPAVGQAAPPRETKEVAPANSTKAQRDWRWYELKKGDVYTKVASRLLGSSDRWTELADMNKDIFPDPSRIQYGVRIRVPIEAEMIATTGTREG